MPRTSTPTSATQKSDVEAQPSMPPTRAAHPQEEESKPAEATAGTSAEDTPTHGEDTDSDAESDFFDSDYETDTDSDFDKPHFYCHESETGSFTISIGCNFPVDAEQRAGGLDPVGRNSNMPRSSRRRAISTAETDTMEERHAYWEDVKRRCEEEIRAEEAHEAANSSH